MALTSERRTTHLGAEPEREEHEEEADGPEGSAGHARDALRVRDERQAGTCNHGNVVMTTRVASRCNDHQPRTFQKWCAWKVPL